MDRELLLKAVLVFSVIGLGVAGYQTYEHYYITSSFCDLSSTFSCSAVTGSQYGEFPPNSGIATAAWGVLWWLAVIALAGDQLRGKRFENEEFYLFTAVSGGLLFVAYLLAVELYVLPQETGSLAICPLCTVQHVIIVMLLLPASYLMLERPILDYLEDVFYQEVEEDGGEEA